MKITHIGNMANDSFPIVEALRKLGVDAELIIESKAFLMSNPLWETSDIFNGEDPYAQHDLLKLVHSLPDWIRIWWQEGKLTDTLQLFKMGSEYDLLQVHAPYSAYLQFSGKPMVVHEAGWIRRLIYGFPGDRIGYKLGRRAYHVAASVVWTNPDTKSMVEATSPRRMDFIPFAIDAERYSPAQHNESNDVLQFFHPTRQAWDIKGNDKLILAFSHYLKAGYKGHLTMVDWGWEEDVQAAKRMITALGIHEHVTWIQPVPKLELIKRYRESDVIFDQYILGSSGTTGFEAMSCSKPVVMYLNQDVNAECLGEMPPVVNCKNENEIFLAMVALNDEDYRKAIGNYGREFVLKYMTPEIVARKTKKLYEEILA